MNRYMIVCRLRWPAILLLTGVIALLNQADILTWGHAWPLYLILWGLLALAERAAMASDPSAAQPNYSYATGYQATPPGYPAPSYPAPGTPTAQSYPPAPGYPPPAPASTEIVPVHTDLEAQANQHEREPRKSWEEEER